MAEKGYAVITGASAGIGEYFARQLAKAGYPLVLVARRKERLEQLAKELKEKHDTECVVITCDVSKTEECHRLMDEVKDLPIEILINNAGFGDCGRFTEGDLTKELDMVDVNVKAVHILMKLVLQKWSDLKDDLDTKSASHEMPGASVNAHQHSVHQETQQKNQHYILNVASSAGLIPAGPYMATYYATKAYVTSITQAVARELKEEKSSIYVGCLCPGPVDTEFNSIANVEFALKGITPEYCAAYGLKQMFRKKTVIIPTFPMKIALTLGRLIPRKWYVAIAGMQQKKKLSGDLK